MYVKKFEGESLTETLNLVKKELGPDAIILKTIDNKGIKGAFKKAKIEVTAAISEENYYKKAKVDKVFSSEQKESFYKAPANEISSHINSYSSSENRSLSSGYGNMGLNKVVNTVSKASNKLMSSLDDFLSSVPEDHETSSINDSDATDELVFEAPKNLVSSQGDSQIAAQLEAQQRQIAILQKRLDEMKGHSSVSSSQGDKRAVLEEMMDYLKSLGLSESVVREVRKKSVFEMAEDELSNSESVFEFALGKLSEMINVDMPLFSHADLSNEAVITVLVSEATIGQRSMATKLAILNNKSRVITYRHQVRGEQKSSFSERMFDIENIHVSSLPELLGEVRKALGQEESIILDIKTEGSDLDVSKKMLETLQKSFENLEVLITVSAINSEVYNRKIISKYREFSDGIIISYMDQCMNFGSLLNLHFGNRTLPLKFFGTGSTVPDDIEAASAERLLGEMFRL